MHTGPDDLEEDATLSMQLSNNVWSQHTEFLALLQLEAVKLTRKNADVKPFEAGGEGHLEHFAKRADAALFALGTSTKKRPNNLTLGERTRISVPRLEYGY